MSHLVELCDDSHSLQAQQQKQSWWPTRRCSSRPKGLRLLLEALGLENVRRSLYGDNKSALALCQGDVGAWRTRHLRLRAAGLRAAVGCEVSGWHTHHVKGTELPADGLAKAADGTGF